MESLSRSIRRKTQLASACRHLSNGLMAIISACDVDSNSRIRSNLIINDDYVGQENNGKLNLKPSCLGCKFISSWRHFRGFYFYYFCTTWRKWISEPVVPVVPRLVPTVLGRKKTLPRWLRPVRRPAKYIQSLLQSKKFN